MITNARCARGLPLSLTIAMSLSVVSVFAQTPTFTRTDYPGFGNTHIVADFNGDGKPDLAGTGLPAVSIRLNNGNGTFGEVVDYPVFQTPNSAQGLAAGDFNGDGRLDLVVTLNDPVTSLSLLTGNGDGTFNPPANFPNTSGFDSPAVAAVDLNNDGLLDIVIPHDIACFTGPCVVTTLMSVMIGNGDGTFQPTRVIDVGRGMSAIAVGDFNRDGRKDLAIAGMQGQVYRLYGVGDGTFVQQPTLTVVVDTFFIPATDIDVADFNGDSFEDLVVAVPHNGSRTAIVLGNGDGTFQTPLIITEPNLNIPHRQAVADFNGDGFPDLALSLADGLTGLMEILNGNGNGTFQPRVLYLPPPPTSSGGAQIVAADLNGDNKPDIALNRSGAFGGGLVLINSTGAAPPPTPAAPTLLTPAANATVAQPVTFDWNNVANAVSYEIQIDNSSNISAPFTASQIVFASQATIGSLPAQQLWWRVRARNSAGVFGPFSGTRRFTAQAAPTALSAITLDPTIVTVVGGNTLTGTATLTAAAPTGGAVVTLSDNSTAASVPASVTIPAGATSTTFTVSTVSVTTSTLVTITGTFGGATRSATLTVTPPPPPIVPTSLGLSPSTVEGGNFVTGTIFFSGSAPPGGLVVSLSSSNTEAATVPATKTFFLSSGTFTVTTLAGPTTRTTTITASANGVSKTATLTVNPSGAPPPAPTASALSLSPATVQGGNSSIGTVTLSAAAPTGGAVVTLASNSSAATVQPSVTVAQGATSATFLVTTSTVAVSTPVTLTASAGGVSRTAALTVTPAATNVTLTVTATGRSGERITSSPAGINVAVGSTGSGSFAANSSITLSVTNGRDAIWSGACSSGGNKRRTCTFTITGNAAVSANVQ